MVTHPDVDALRRELLDLSAVVPDLDAFSRAASALVRRAVPFDASCLVALDPESGLVTGANVHDVSGELAERFLADLDDLRTFGDGMRAIREDRAGRGVHEMRTVLRSAGIVWGAWGIARTRGRGFGAAESAVVIGLADVAAAAIRAVLTGRASIALTRAAAPAAPGAATTAASATASSATAASATASSATASSATASSAGPSSAAPGDLPAPTATAPTPTTTAPTSPSAALGEGRTGTTGRAATPGPAVLVLGPGDEVRLATPAARERLTQLGPGPGLPPCVGAIARRARRVADPGDVGRARIRTASGTWLVLRAARAARPDRDGERHGDVVLSIEVARPADVVPVVTAAWGLTRREQEVVGAVLGGASTAGISARLGMSPYTVQDHLKAVFAKAGVTTRRELVARLVADESATPPLPVPPSPPSAPSPAPSSPSPSSLSTPAPSRGDVPANGARPEPTPPGGWSAG